MVHGAPSSPTIDATIIELDEPIPGLTEPGEDVMYRPGHPEGDLVAVRRRVLDPRALPRLLHAAATGGRVIVLAADPTPSGPAPSRSAAPTSARSASLADAPPPAAPPPPAPPSRGVLALVR